MFKKEMFNDMRKDITEALKGFEEKYGVKVHAGNISYSETEFTLQLKVASNVTETEEWKKEEFRRLCPIYDMEPSDYGKEIVIRGTKYKLVGFKPERPKFCVSVLRIPDGKSYLLPPDALDQIRKGRASL